MSSLWQYISLLYNCHANLRVTHPRLRKLTSKSALQNCAEQPIEDYMREKYTPFLATNSTTLLLNYGVTETVLKWRTHEVLKRIPLNKCTFINKFHCGKWTIIGHVLRRRIINVIKVDGLNQYCSWLGVGLLQHCLQLSYWNWKWALSNAFV